MSWRMLLRRQATIQAATFILISSPLEKVETEKSMMLFSDCSYPVELYRSHQVEHA